MSYNGISNSYKGKVTFSYAYGNGALVAGAGPTKRKDAVKFPGRWQISICVSLYID